MTQRMVRIIALFALSLFLVIPSLAQSSVTTSKPKASRSTGAVPAPVSPPGEFTHIYMHNLIYRAMRNVALRIYDLNGIMAPTQQGQIVSLDNSNSFTLVIQSARISMAAADLTALVNGYILPQAGTPMHDLTMVLNADHTVFIRGRFHKLIDVPFTAQATMSATPDGNMRMHLYNMKIGGILDQSVLDFLGMKVSRFAQPKKQQLFQVVGNDMIFPIARMFPPPQVGGKLTSLFVSKGMLNLEFRGGSPTTFSLPRPAESYVLFLGGTMRFGRLTMTPVEMELVNVKPKMFELSLEKYFQQLTAGHSKSLPDGGLLVYMASYQDLPKGARTRN